MDSLGHSLFPPTALGRQDDEEVTPGERKTVENAGIPLSVVRFRVEEVNYDTCSGSSTLRRSRSLGN
ncbi:hypothetical protein TNCV_4854571 [Trichonephila clavipes]|nr:hypothetical protein TNCV_4854571 [Trichonephila clavipes]